MCATGGYKILNEAWLVSCKVYFVAIVGHLMVASFGGGYWNRSGVVGSVAFVSSAGLKRLG